ncbi:MAG: flagellar biosynthesis protein FlhF [Armatimonadota bacterium]
MELRKFQANTMREALDLVRRELGEDAVILNTQVVDAGDGQQETGIEVWAQLPEGAPLPLQDDVTPLFEQALFPVLPADSGEDAEQVDPLLEQMQVLTTQLTEVHARLGLLAENMGWLGIGTTGDAGDLEQSVSEGILRQIPVSGGIRHTGGRHIVAFIGPTGVGKTTVVSKLAAWYAAEGHMVGIITTDTYRLGALDQMRVLCNHLDVPLATAYTPDDMNHALAQLARCEIILVDTPGIAPRNTTHLDELAELIHTADPAEIHLVISACQHRVMTGEVLQQFNRLHPDQVVLTKLDESAISLEVCALLIDSGLAISYLCDDAAVTSSLAIANLDNLSLQI